MLSVVVLNVAFFLLLCWRSWRRKWALTTIQFNSIYCRPQSQLIFLYYSYDRNHHDKEIVVSLTKIITCSWNVILGPIITGSSTTSRRLDQRKIFSGASWTAGVAHSSFHSSLLTPSVLRHQIVHPKCLPVRIAKHLSRTINILRLSHDDHHEWFLYY